MGGIFDTLKVKIYYIRVLRKGMYECYYSNKKVKKRIQEYIKIRDNITEKLIKLKNNPRRECGAHPLHGLLQGKWSCWLGSNMRMVYVITMITK